MSNKEPETKSLDFNSPLRLFNLWRFFSGEDLKLSESKIDKPKKVVDK